MAWTRSRRSRKPLLEYCSPMKCRPSDVMECWPFNMVESICSCRSWSQMPGFISAQEIQRVHLILASQPFIGKKHTKPKPPWILEIGCKRSIRNTKTPLLMEWRFFIQCFGCLFFYDTVACYYILH